METAHVLEPELAETPPTDFPLSMPARALLAVLSIGAGTIHLVMVPAHAAGWLAEGIAFAFAGWFQIAFGIAVLLRPTKRLLAANILVNMAFIGVWAITRTVGLPFGPESGHKEAATLVDLTCVGLQAALVLASFVLVRSPRLGEKLNTQALVVASVIPLGVVVLTTAVLASPSGQHHDHGNEVAAGAGANHGDDHGAMDHSATGAMDHAAGDHDSMDHSATGPMDHAAGDHDATPAVSASDRCDWQFNTTAFWSANPPTFDDGTHTHDHSKEGAAPAADATVGNKKGLQVWPPMTDQAKCTQLKADLAVMESFQKKYPTAADAVAGGCVRVTIYVPGIAAHYACFKNWDDKMDVNKPEMLLYGGSQPWAPLVGLSYYSTGATQPGPEWEFGLMPFHVHNGLCVKGTLVIGGDGSTKEECEARGGKVLGKTGFMGHYWVPNCSSPDGVFSADNPRLDIGVANVNDDPKYDPANGGDPTVLQQDPCAGSTMKDKPPFGQPGVADNGQSETASGPVNTNK